MTSIQLSLHHTPLQSSFQAMSPRSIRTKVQSMTLRLQRNMNKTFPPTLVRTLTHHAPLSQHQISSGHPPHNEKKNVTTSPTIPKFPFPTHINPSHHQYLHPNHRAPTSVSRIKKTLSHNGNKAASPHHSTDDKAPQEQGNDSVYPWYLGCVI